MTNATRVLRYLLLTAACIGGAWGSSSAEEVPAASTGFAAPEISGEYAITGAKHWTGGLGADRALIDQGTFLTNQLKLMIDQPLHDGWSFDTDLDLRHTQDEQIDERDSLHLLGWTSELYNETWRLTGGDFFADYSQYTASVPLTGTQLSFYTEEFEAKGAFGYSQRDIEGVQYRRWVGAGRTEALVLKEWSFLKDVRIGANFASTEDDGSSIENAAGVSDASNRVGSTNFHALVGETTEFNGELAKSWIDTDTTDPSLQTTPAAFTNRQMGTALKLGTFTRFSKMTRMRLGYEWASVDFGTLSGSAIPDQVSYNGRVDHKFSNTIAGEFAYRLFHNKLDKSAENKRTVTQTPHVAFTWQPISDDWFFRDYYARAYFDERTRLSEDDPSGQVDFQSRIYGIEEEFKLWEKFQISNGYELRVEDDDFNKIALRYVNSFNIGVRTREKWCDMTAIPSLRYQVDYEDMPKEEGRDLSQTVTAALNLQINERLTFDQRYSVNFANRLLHDSDSIRINAFLALDYRVPVKQDLKCRLSYDHLDYMHESSLVSFSEDNLQTSLIWNF